MDSAFILDTFSYLLRGAGVSLQIAGISCLIGLSLGTLLALMQTGTNAISRTFATLYVGLIRGTPMLVQIMIVFYVLPRFGLSLPAFWAAVLAIGMNSSAYLSQVIRAGITSIGKGQWEAAQILGFTRGQTLRYIILPQTVRVILPALSNEFVTLLKDSSLASTIGAVELVKEGTLIISRTYKVIPVYLMITCIYLAMTSVLFIFFSWLERRMKHA